ncbi:helix-turn-helix transcriptional regulator [Catellatospora sichuanensis]|uniref:helix-turn-helix transcriptional regulator n=1 Tax=Catellatospora sichuanensis TaxID=1969805 RepID=UPI0011829D6D|nr:helix-turn-helix transcriptional regulator [Catellatospora sichuanensis]
MLDAPVVPSLTRWGVSPHADLVYRTLITFGPWSVEHISRSLEMKSRLVRTALDELTALGAAVPARRALVEGTGDDRIWSTRAPAQVVALLRDRHHHTALARHRLRQRLTRMTYPDIVTDLGRLPVDDARPLDGLSKTIERLLELAAAERHEHMSMNPEPAFSAAALKTAAPAERKMLARGISFLSLGVPASTDDESEVHDTELRFHGMQYRELPQVPGKMIIFDRATALVPQDPSDRTRGMWEISAPRVVAELTALFLQQWAQAKDPGRDWTPPAHLTPRESTIVVLLARGYTDAALAAKLDISVRTIAYTLSALMDRYDVINRFQLGLRLGAEAAQHAPVDETTHEPEGE